MIIKMRKIKDEERLFFGDMNRGPSLVMSDHDGDGTDPEPGTGKAGVIPDGYAYTWNVYAYDADAGVAMVLSVDRDGVFDVFEDEILVKRKRDYRFLVILEGVFRFLSILVKRKKEIILGRKRGG